MFPQIIRENGCCSMDSLLAHYLQVTVIDMLYDWSHFINYYKAFDDPLPPRIVGKLRLILVNHRLHSLGTIFD